MIAKPENKQLAPICESIIKLEQQKRVIENMLEQEGQLLSALLWQEYPTRKKHGVLHLAKYSVREKNCKYGFDILRKQR